MTMTPGPEPVHSKQEVRLAVISTISSLRADAPVLGGAPTIRLGGEPGTPWTNLEFGEALGYAMALFAEFSKMVERDHGVDVGEFLRNEAGELVLNPPEGPAGFYDFGDPGSGRS